MLIKLTKANESGYVTGEIFINTDAIVLLESITLDANHEIKNLTVIKLLDGSTRWSTETPDKILNKCVPINGN